MQEQKAIHVHYKRPSQPTSESDILHIEMEGGRVKGLSFDYIRETATGKIEIKPEAAQILQTVSGGREDADEKSVRTIQPDGTVKIDCHGNHLLSVPLYQREAGQRREVRG